MHKRSALVCAILSICMVFTMIPLNADAEEPEGEVEAAEEEDAISTYASTDEEDSEAPEEEEPKEEEVDVSEAEEVEEAPAEGVMEDDPEDWRADKEPIIDEDDPMKNGRPNLEASLEDNYGISTYSLKSTGKIKACGIDVSYYDGTINWSKVAADGVDFAIIRIGYRGYSNGKLVTDTQAINNLKGAQKAGVKIGAYFFSTALNETEAKEEAKYVVNIIKDYKISYPVAYDCEGYQMGSKYRDYNLSNSQRTKNAIAFLDYVQSKGYTGLMYACKSDLTNNSKWNTTKLEGMYPIWVAQYPYRSGTTSMYSSFSQAKSASKSTTYTGAYRIWQFSSGGSVSGISAKVDLNFDYNTTGSVSTTVSGSASSSNAVSSLKATDQTKSSISLSWKKFSGADGYQVRRKVSGGSYETVTTTSSTSYKDKSLKQGQLYYYKVRAYTTDSSGKKTYTDYSSVVKAATKPKTPTSFKASATAFDTIKLSWGKVSGASGYQIQRYDSSKKKYKTVKTITSGSTKSYSNGSLNASTKYKYRMRAYISTTGGKVYSSYSKVISKKTKKSVKGTVKSSEVNLRSGPGTSYKKLKTVKKGKTLTITGSSGSWYRTSTKVNGKKKTCYVKKSYVKLKSSSSSSSSSSTTYVKYKTTTKVNYRSGAGTSKAVKGTLKKGETIQVEKGYSKKADGYTWYRFKKNGKKYYIASKYVKKA